MVIFRCADSLLKNTNSLHAALFPPILQCFTPTKKPSELGATCSEKPPNLPKLLGVKTAPVKVREDTATGERRRYRGASAYCLSAHIHKALA
jgi:hypothetical protein